MLSALLALSVLAGPPCSTESVCRIGCNRGDAAFCMALGDLLRPNESRRRETVDAFRSACRLGSAHACARAGFYLVERTHDSRAVAEAIPLFRSACDRGDALGCSNLGAFYADGEGVAPDARRAHQLWIKACAAGDGFSCGSVAVDFLAGTGIARDLDQALHCADKGCTRDSPRSCVVEGRVLLALPPPRRDARRAATLFAGACSYAYRSTGDARSNVGCVNLAYLYEQGDGVPKDLARARDLFAKSCAQGTLPNACTEAAKLATQAAPR